MRTETLTKILEPEDEDADYHTVAAYVNEDDEDAHNTYSTHKDPRYDNTARQLVRDQKQMGHHIKVTSGYYG